MSGGAWPFVAGSGIRDPVRPVSRLTLASGAPWLRLADGRPWSWRYCSALDLLARTDAEHDEFLDWAKGTGFTGVRAAATTLHDPPLSPALGQARLPRLCSGLGARGMGAEVIALADTKLQAMSRDQMRAHVAAVGRLVDGVDLPLTVEIANENGHDTQQADLTDVRFLQELRALIPRRIPVALGCWGDDTRESYTGGDYLTQHRDRGRGTFEEAVRVKHLIELAHDARRFVVDDEPIGAAEADIPGKRSADPARYFAHAVLGKLGNLGSTFHFDLGVPARIPAPGSRQQACAEAFIAGATLVSDDAVFAFRNDSAGDGITRGADWSKVFKVFGFIRQGRGQSYVVALGVTGDIRANYVNDWRPAGVVAEYPGVQVIEVAR